MQSKIIKPTPFGSVAVIWAGQNHNYRIVRILLSKPGVSAEERAFEFYPDSVNSSCAGIEDLSTAIRRFLAGEKIEFSLDSVDLSLCSEFQRLVLRAEHRIPRGSVSTYKLIAEYLGKSRAERAVGNALSSNPFPLIVPCHRAIRSDGYPGGYQGGSEMKRALLQNEGISFDERGRVTNARFYYEKGYSNRGGKTGR